MNENCTENVGVWGSGLMIVTKYADRPFLGGQQDNGAVNNTTAARAKALEKNRSSVNKYVYFVVTVGNISMCKNSRESILLRYEKWRYRRRSPYIIHTMPPSYFISFLLHYFAVDHCINCLVAQVSVIEIYAQIPVCLWKPAGCWPKTSRTGSTIRIHIKTTCRSAKCWGRVFGWVDLHTGFGLGTTWQAKKELLHQIY